MTLSRLAALATGIAFLTVSLVPAHAQRRKKKDEDFTQKLEVLPDPPSVLTVETNKLFFVTAPLSGKGLLTQQVKDGLKAILAQTRRLPVVKIRAFVAGTGDMRRIQAIVSEEFSDRKLPLPVLSVVQVGSLPLDGAQVQIEATAVEKKVVNPDGLAFLSGQAATREGPLQLHVAPLAEESLSNLRKAADATGAGAENILRLTCFLTSLDDVSEVRASAAKHFPAAQQVFVQTQRSPAATLVECEAVARLKKRPARPVEFVNPAGLAKSNMYSQAALIGAPQVVLAGSQLAFRYSEDDARLAFQRLDRTLAAAKSSLKHAVMVNTYPLSPLLMDLVRKVRFDYLNPAHPPASTMLPVEGLPAMDGAFALEVVALPSGSSSSPNP